MQLTHKIQLDPTCKQRCYFARAAGTQRLVWNWALAEWNRQHAVGEKPTGDKLKKQFNAVKYGRFPWLADIHRDAHAQPFADLQCAFANFFGGRSARPSFKSKGIHDSFYVANDKFTLTDRCVRLPKIGNIRLREALRFVGKIQCARVVGEAGRWFLCVAVDVGEFTKPRTSDDIVGVDLGLTTLATLSTGEKVPNPRPLQRAQRKIARAQRCLSRRVKGSHNRSKQRLVVSKIHRRIRNIRHDVLNKLTTRLCRENQAVVIEDLNASGMAKNHRLARSISDASFREIRRQLNYKSVLYGTRIVVADRFFPSTKRCSACGHVVDEIPLSQRTFECPACGYVADRDLNAAINLRTVGLTGIYACGPEGSGSRTATIVKPRRVEAGTKQCSLSSTL